MLVRFNSPTQKNGGDFFGECANFHYVCFLLFMVSVRGGTKIGVRRGITGAEGDKSSAEGLH